ncbi:hypothetical protein [Patiriisocius sp. Uisw_017]|uniref:hypothetical protein n=1 Tax=Patiriisocius sp. Uisw_017 TaxID=3230968 RepID=UPI0039EAE5E2
MKKGLEILLILLTFSCCTKSQVESSKIGADFDLNESTIYLTLFTSDIGSIISFDLKTNKIDSITNPENGYDLRPRISSNRKSILYISFPLPEKEHPHLILKNLVTNSIDTILKNQPFLTEAVFSKDEKEAFFFCASEYKNYSPIVRPKNHGFDLYRVNFDTKEVIQITDKKEYDMRLLRLAENGESIYCTIPPEEGIVSISTKTGKKTSIDFKGNPRKQVEGWFNLIALRNDSALYEALYEIYEHDFTENQSEFILRSPDNSHFQIIKTDTTWNNLIFTTSSNGLFVYNRKSKEVTDLKREIIK